MSFFDSDELIIEAVKKHYDEYDSPYYLASFGQWFRSQQFDMPDGIRFKDYLKSRFHGRLVIVQDEDNPVRVAIAPPDKERRVKQQLAGWGNTELDNSKIDYSRLPIALIAAFCKVPMPGTQIYFRVTKPFRYETRMQAPGDMYIEIEDKFRPLRLAGSSVHDLSYDDKLTIYGLIDKWAEAKSVDLRDLYYDRGSKSDENTKRSVHIEDNALQRLISAQEPELRKKLRIPGDIANILMDMP